MENVTQFPVAAAPPCEVVALCCPQNISFDAEPLRALFVHRDQHLAEEMICRILEHIAARLDQLQQWRDFDDLESLVRVAKRIDLMGRQLGLTEVANAALHVAHCLDNKDPIAFEATRARLERAFDTAVSHVWDVRGL